MAPQYAKDQPTGFKNHIEKIAVVGAGGQVGGAITRALVAAGKHTVTALTRATSSTPLPSGIHHTVAIDYESHDSLVAALRGQDVLIITMSVMAPPTQQPALIRAAADAGVRYVMPNEYGSDFNDTSLGEDVYLGPPAVQVRALIESLGVSSWVSLCNGFWYEFSLANGTSRFGFDFKNRTLRYYEDGQQKINVSTWEQCGRAVATVFALKALPEDENDKDLTLASFSNRYVYIRSFYANQKDMFASVLRVTGDKESDWTITSGSSKHIWEDGWAKFKQGDFEGFAELLYSRMFWPDGSADYAAHKGLDNERLGLKDEDFDAATARAIEMAKNEPGA